MEDIYEKPFGIVSSRLYENNPFYYTNMDINRFDTGFFGNVLLSSNTHISINNNIGRLNGDTVFKDNSDTNDNIIVLRDTLNNGL